jgi:hypothetical protein
MLLIFLCSLVAAEETKRIRRNLFSGGGGVKLERRQSVAVMETDKGGKSAKSRVKQLSHSSKGKKLIFTL